MAESLQDQVKEAKALRDMFRIDLQSLVAHGLHDASILKKVTRMHGFQNVASTLLLLGEFFRLNWSKIDGRTCVTVDDVDKAIFLAHAITMALVRREGGTNSFIER